MGCTVESAGPSRWAAHRGNGILASWRTDPEGYVKQVQLSNGRRCRNDEQILEKLYGTTFRSATRLPQEGGATVNVLILFSGIAGHVIETNGTRYERTFPHQSAEAGLLLDFLRGEEQASIVYDLIVLGQAG
jgi:hypothetical protein